MRRLAAALLVLAVAGCARARADETPEGAVRELLDRLRRLEGRPEESEAAFELLADETRQNLVARAQRYGAASGKHIAPELMIAPASFLERFEVREFSSQIKGRYATVTVAGLLPDERATVPCVYEEGGWRVRIELPPLSPVEVRPRDGDVTRPKK